MFQAVVFDMNGVIIDDERVHQESWRRLCKKLNLHLTEEEFKHKVFGRTEADTFEYLLKRRLSAEELEERSGHRVDIAIDIFKPDLALTVGLLEFLTSLRSQKIPLAIATSSRIPYTNFILDTLNIREYFGGIVTAQDIIKGKPDPEIYLKAAQTISVPPENCVAFEDSLSGIKSAKAAGMKVIAITTTHTADELQIADTVIGSFKGISLKALSDLFII